jgi:hypothetical protein
MLGLIDTELERMFGDVREACDRVGELRSTLDGDLEK